MLKKLFTAKILGVVAVANFGLFFFFLAFPYYFLLGTSHYAPKANPSWGFFMPASVEAWVFFVLAFVFLGLAAVTIGVLIWKRPDLTQRGIHQI